jgi:PAS domain S-box-containing protein
VSGSNKGFGGLLRLLGNRNGEAGASKSLKAATDAVYLAEIQNLTQTGSIAWNFANGSVHWSAETYRICGVDPETVLSRELILKLVHPDDARAFGDAVDAAIKGRARFDHELRIVRPNGDVRTIHMVGRFLAEKPEQFVGAMTDVTERRLEEEARRTSDFHYRNMFVALAAAFWELDFSGVTPILRNLRQQGIKDLSRYFADNPEVVREMMRATRVIDVNDQAVSLFGRGIKDELLTSVEPFWADSSLQVYAASVIASMRRAPGFSAETRLRRIDGTEFDGLFTVSFPPEGVATSKFLIAVIDISERVNAQAALRNLQAELAHAARLSTLGELAASIAHEVNQPLAAITTNASASVRWLDRPQPNLEEVKTLAARIAADARRAADIISRIRDMATRRTTETAPISVASVIEEAAAFLRHDMQAQRVSLQLDLAPDLPVVIGDRTQLQQVVVNLAMNAAQAMVHVPAGQRRIIIGAQHSEGAIVVTIDDDGPGIAREHLDHLFQSFFTTKENGMGIGLPICRTIVEAHGGQIRVENRAAGGARVTVSLPVGAAAGAASHTNV